MRLLRWLRPLVLLLLVRWRAKAACLGALLILLALAFEPFAQQSVTFYGKDVAANGAKAFIPRTTIYDLGTILQTPHLERPLLNGTLLAFFKT